MLFCVALLDHTLKGDVFDSVTAEVVSEYSSSHCSREGAKRMKDGSFLIGKPMPVDN